MFLDECDYLIHLIRCAIHGLQPRELPEELDFKWVYECGAFHQVANIAFYSVEKLAKKPDEALYRKWEACRDKAVVRHINQSYAAQEIRSSFQDAGIRWLEVQGTKIKPLYPQPEWRTMSDIDFLIDQENLPKAAQILQNLGYQWTEKPGVEVDGFRSPNINVEIHSQYFPKKNVYHDLLEPPFASVEKTGQYALNEFYLYNILHIAKHYFGDGCGIRRVLDVYYLNRNYGQIIDRAYIQSILERGKADDFAAEISGLADIWFGEREQSVPRSEMARSILGAGLHGNRTTQMKNHVKQTLTHPTRFTKFKYLVGRILGTGGKLQRTYPILKRYPILTPFCWLHRAIRALRPKGLQQISKELKAVRDAKAPNVDK